MKEPNEDRNTHNLKSSENLQIQDLGDHQNAGEDFSALSSGLHPLISTLYERILQDEIAQSLRPNGFTPEQDVQQMRQFYFDRVAEIVKDQIIGEKDSVI